MSLDLLQPYLTRRRQWTTFAHLVSLYARHHMLAYVTHRRLEMSPHQCCHAAYRLADLERRLFPRYNPDLQLLRSRQHHSAAMISEDYSSPTL